MNRLGENFSLRFLGMTGFKSRTTPAFPEYGERKEDRHFESPLLRQRGNTKPGILQFRSPIARPKPYDLSVRRAAPDGTHLPSVDASAEHPGIHTSIGGDISHQILLSTPCVKPEDEPTSILAKTAARE